MKYKNLFDWLKFVANIVIEHGKKVADFPLSRSATGTRFGTRSARHGTQMERKGT